MRAMRLVVPLAVSIVLVSAVGLYRAAPNLRGPTKTEAFADIRHFIELSGDPIFRSRPEVPVYVEQALDQLKRGALDRVDRLATFEASRLKPLALAAAQFRRRAEEQATILAKLQEIDERIKSNNLFAVPPELVTTLCAFSDEPSETCRTAGKGTMENLSLRSVRADYEKAYWRAINENGQIWAQSILPLLDQYSPGTQVPTIGIDFDECWCSEHKQDTLAMKNLSGAALQNVVVLVHVLDEKRSFYQYAWHVVENWPAGETIYAPYAEDLPYFRPRTFEQVGALQVMLWGDDLTPRLFDYQYTGAERNRDLAAYMAQIHVTGISYLTFEDHFLFDDQPGLSLTLDSTIAAPHQVLVTFSTPGAKPVGLSWSQKSWAGSRPIEFRSEQFSYKPSKIEVGIRFDRDGGGSIYPLGTWTLR